MSSIKVTNINDCTLIQKGNLVNNIYFYPQYSMLGQRIKSRKHELCVLFELKKEKEPKLYYVHTYLLNKDDEKVFHSYSMYFKKIDRYKYVILKTKNDANHAETIKEEIIDFNTLNYESFLEILSKNNELAKMIPELKEGLLDKVETLEKAKRKVAYIDIPSMSNYYQNIAGYLIDVITTQLATKEDLEYTQKILRNVHRNFNVILHNQQQITLSLLVVYATIINKIKGTTIKPKSILDTKDVKTDTNKTSIQHNDLDFILNSFLASLEDEDYEIEEELNIIQERIEYILTSKPKLKEITNFIKVILIADEYIDSSKRNRSIEETQLKELIINSFISYSYRPLPRNQVLIYNEKNNIIDFICIISLDKVLELFHTYHLNRSEENKQYLEILKTIDNIIIKGQHKKTKTTLSISILSLIHILIYNYKNINSKALLFDKGNFILNLDYNNGQYDIRVVNKLNNKKYGKLNKLTPETSQNIKKSLDKGEKSFNSYTNNLIYNSLETSLTNLNIEIIINDLTIKDVLLKFKKTNANDSFECEFTIGEFLSIISNIKNPKESRKNTEKEVVIQEVENDKNVLDEKTFIIRKAHTIVEIMEQNPINNKNYQKVVELYKELETADPSRQEEILLNLKELI